MTKPEISIVLPVFQGEAFLREAIDSVLQQTFRDWELLIVDDASTDMTPSIARQYSNMDHRVKVIRNEENRKLPASLNIGFSHAQGRLLTWTSHDNRFLPNALERMYAALNETGDVDLVYADYHEIDENGVRVRLCRLEAPVALTWDNVVRCCFLYLRSLADRVGPYDERSFCAEDYDFWLRAYSVGQFVHLNEALYEYRVHDQSLSIQKYHRVLAATDQALARHMPPVEKVGKPARARGFHRLMTNALLRRSRCAALKYALQSYFSDTATARSLVTRKDWIKIMLGFGAYEWLLKRYLGRKQS